MNPRDDAHKGRNPAAFITRSSGPSFVDVDNVQHPPTLALFGHEDCSTPLRPTALIFVPISARSMVFDLDAVLSGTLPPPPPVPVGEVDPILSLDPDYLRQRSEQDVEDFLASPPLDTIPEQDGIQPPLPSVFTMVSKGSKTLLGTLFGPPTASGLSFSGPDARSAGQVIRDSKSCLKWRVVG
jgi:hypothetical protein